MCLSRCLCGRRRLKLFMASAPQGQGQALSLLLRACAPMAATDRAGNPAAPAPRHLTVMVVVGPQQRARAGPWVVPLRDHRPAGVEPRAAVSQEGLVAGLVDLRRHLFARVVQIASHAAVGRLLQKIGCAVAGRGAQVCLAAERGLIRIVHVAEPYPAAGRRRSGRSRRGGAAPAALLASWGGTAPPCPCAPVPPRRTRRLARRG